MGAAREIRTRAHVEALVLEALDGIASPEAREQILTHALEAAGRRRLPKGARESVAFATGPLREAVAAALGEQEAAELVDQLLYLMGRAVEASSPPPSDEVSTSGVPAAEGSTLAPPSSGVDSVGNAAPKKSAVARRVSPPTLEGRNTTGPSRRTKTAAYASALLTGASDARRVLLLDDDPSCRRALGRLLTASGYEVTSAADAHTALWMCERLDPHVVVTDYELDGTNGLAFATELARRLGERKPPVLLVTSSTILPRVTSDVAGAMLKDADQDALLAKVAELASLRTSAR